MCAVVFGRPAGEQHATVLRKAFPGETIKKSPTHLVHYRTQIEEYFAGIRTHFSVRVDLRAVSSEFKRTVLTRCRKIPFGSVMSYGELAESAGSPGAARAVGTTMSSNPIPIVIPCHRVVASDGLGGFSSGVSNKRTLLSHEGVLMF